METSIYRRLAQRLDAIPNGFPATKSGIELRLLQKIFAPEEAGLAAVMRLTPEPSIAIARSDFTVHIDMSDVQAVDSVPRHAQPEH